jgi:hypothetical protein
MRGRILTMRIIPLTLLMLLGGSTRGLHAQQNVRSAPAQRAAIEDALLAQASGPMGCSTLQSVTDTAIVFFPSVRILTGRCIAEHGDTLRSFVALDSAGILYLLDSPSGFAFLLKRHRPALGSSADLAEYVRAALVFSGRLSGDGRVVRSIAGIPADVPRGIAHRYGGYTTAAASSGNGRLSLRVLMDRRGGLATYSAVILADGVVVTDSATVWRRRVQSPLN